MGEIGIDRKEYLYDLTWCDLLLIERGYWRRSRDLWSSARWSTFYIMSSFSGSKALAENGINSPKDLLQFPWEKEKFIISEDDQRKLLKEMEEYNKGLAKEVKSEE